MAVNLEPESDECVWVYSCTHSQPPPSGKQDYTWTHTITAERVDASMWSLESMPVAQCPLVGGVKQHRCVMKSAVTTGWECMHISMKETCVDEHPTWLHYRFGPFLDCICFKLFL